MSNNTTVLSVAVVLCLSACGGPEKVTAEFSETMAHAPGWATKDCAVYAKEKGEKPKLCGVGSVAGSRNIALARTAAEARGRTAIARTLDLKVKAMLKDYQATTTGGEGFGTQAADEQHAEDVSKQITEMTLSGTRVEDTWISPHDGTYFVLMVLDAEAFKDAVGKMKNLSESVRKAVIERADKAFGELDKATDGQK